MQIGEGEREGGSERDLGEKETEERREKERDGGDTHTHTHARTHTHTHPKLRISCMDGKDRVLKTS